MHAVPAWLFLFCHARVAQILYLYITAVGGIPWEEVDGARLWVGSSVVIGKRTAKKRWKECSSKYVAPCR